MPLVDRLSQFLSGGQGDPEQARRAAMLALISSGLSTVGGAGSQGVGSIIPGLQTGLGTFENALSNSRTAAQQDRRLGLEERRVDLNEQQFNFEQEILADERQRRDFAEFTAQRFWNDPELLGKAIEGFRSGGDESSSDPVLQGWVDSAERAIQIRDFDALQEATEGFLDRQAELLEEPEEAGPKIVNVPRVGLFDVQRDADGNASVIKLVGVPDEPAGTEKPMTESQFFTAMSKVTAFQNTAMMAKIDENGQVVLDPRTGEIEMVPSDDPTARGTPNAEAIFAAYPEYLRSRRPPDGEGDITFEQAIAAVMATDPNGNREEAEALLAPIYAGVTGRTEDELDAFLRGALPAGGTPPTQASGAAPTPATVPNPPAQEDLETILQQLPAEIRARALGRANQLSGQQEKRALLEEVLRVFQQQGFDAALAIVFSG